MTNLDRYMEALREKMQESYLDNDKEQALALSRQLDRLIMLKQREREEGDISVSLTLETNA